MIRGALCLDLAMLEEPSHSASREQLGVFFDRGCVRCGAPPEPEPTDEERARLLADADYEWPRPDGVYICGGFGLVGGGYGPFVICDGCGLFAKHDLGPEAE